MANYYWKKLQNNWLWTCSIRRSSEDQIWIRHWLC